MNETLRRVGPELEALITEIGALATQYDVVRLLKKVTESYGLRAFLVVTMPGSLTQVIQSISVVSSLPTELVSRYDQALMMGTSPVFRRLRASTLPFTADIRALFEGYRLQRYAMFPVVDPDGQRGAVSFYGDRPLLTTQEMLELSMLSIHVFDKLYHMGRHEQRQGEALSEREIDCLNWTAAGKTSAEISEILGLSEHTINHYLNRATRKLDTVNRTQAVAKAIRTGIIS
jgi:DNA-binding CsgD family transcriptional regulator